MEKHHSKRRRGTGSLFLRVACSYGSADEYIQPDMIIDSVELVYFVNSPYLLDAPQSENYIQPAWHFQGRYTNGSVVDILVQALRKEYLSPDIGLSMP